MRVFKQYFKIIKSESASAILPYVILFIAITLIFMNNGNTSAASAFKTSRCDIAIINEDDSSISDSLADYLGANNDLIDIKPDDESIRDALFYRRCEVVITIPDGFGNSLGKENALEIKTQSVPDSNSSHLIKSSINNYLSTAEIYLKSSPDMSMDEINTAVKNDLSVKTDVTLESNDKKTTRSDALGYFNYLAYPLICIFIYCVSTITDVFNKPDLKRRNLCSPLSLSSFNLQIFSGHVILAIAVWIFFMVTAYFMYPKEFLAARSIYYIINSFIFSLCVLSLGYLVANLFPAKAMGPVCNCISLGCCFLGGAFVPQYLLSKQVLHFAVINPAYWYIKSNETIASLSILSNDALSPVFVNYGILAAFTLAFLSLSLLLIKKKRTSENI